MRTAIYLRVSTDDQIDKYGLPSQLRACRDYAKAHGFEVVAEISDEGVSGVILNRPGLDRVRQMVRDGQIDVVLMLDADRLSRELAHLLILKPEIEKRAKLEFVVSKFEDSPSGRMFFGIRGVISQYERELTRERTQRGRVERARDGLIVGGRVAYGYDYRDGVLIPNERADTVRQIFQWMDEGGSIRGIARRLRESGTPTWGGRNWGHSSVQRILDNETYCGLAHYGTHRREGTRLVVRKDESRIALDVPAIISRDQWERVNARDRSKAVGRPSDRYLLRGLLYCSCGRRMNGDQGHGSPSYRCRGRDPFALGGVCKVNVLTKRIDPVVWEAVALAFIDGDLLRSLIVKHQSSIIEAPERTAELRKQIKSLLDRESRTVSLMIEMPEATEDLKAKYRAARKERMGLETELSRIDRAQRWSGSMDDQIDAMTRGLKPVIENMKTENRAEFLRRTTDKMVFNSANQEVSIRCFFMAQNCADHPDVVGDFTQSQRIDFRLVASVA